MKKTILMLALVGVALAACEKKDKDYEFKSGEYIYLNGVEQPKFKSTTKQYTVAEIVRAENVALYHTTEYGGYYRTFDPGQRDTINNRLLMRAEDILTVPDGYLQREYLDATNFYIALPNGELDPSGLLGFKWDTCGYIPQSVIDNAREQIESLYAQERYDEIYELFHTAFTFYTCTGEEYKQIVANGGGIEN